MDQRRNLNGAKRDARLFLICTVMIRGEVASNYGNNFRSGRSDVGKATQFFSLNFQLFPPSDVPDLRHVHPSSVKPAPTLH